MCVDDNNSLCGDLGVHLMQHGLNSYNHVCRHLWYEYSCNTTHSTEKIEGKIVPSRLKSKNKRESAATRHVFVISNTVGVRDEHHYVK